MGCDIKLVACKMCITKAYHYVIPCTLLVAGPMVTTAKPSLPHLGFLPNVPSSATTSGIIWLIRDPPPCTDGFFDNSLVSPSKDKTANDDGRRNSQEKDESGCKRRIR